MAMSADVCENVQPFAGNGDVSICAKNSRVGRKTLKQTNLFYQSVREKLNEPSGTYRPQNHRSNGFCIIQAKNIFIETPVLKNNNKMFHFKFNKQSHPPSQRAPFILYKLL